MGTFREIIAAVTLLIFGLGMGLVIGFCWGRAVGAAESNALLKSFAQQLIQAVNGLLRHTHSASDHLTRLVALYREQDDRPPSDRPETPHLAGIAQSLITMERQLEVMRSESVSRTDGGVIVTTEDRPLVETIATTPAVNANNLRGSPQLSSERRAEVRTPYCAIQRWAPYPAGAIPTQDLFREMQCCDISESGMGFVCDVQPTTMMIVVTTGEPPELVFRTARIASINEVREPVGIRFRIGCEFVGRLCLDYRWTEASNDCSQDTYTHR